MMAWRVLLAGSACARLATGLTPTAGSMRFTRPPTACASSSGAAPGSGRVEVAQTPCLSDNYGFLVHDPDSGLTACVDTPEVAPIRAVLEEKGWQLTHIFNTHHHHDHAGNNAELKAMYPGCQVVGPAREAAKIPGLDVAVSGGDVFDWGSQRVEVIDVGGHTLGHVAFYLPSSDVAFVGDSLFALGCGRLFEGTAEQAWASLTRLMTLPDHTTTYCAHEYTAANARFASTIEPDNTDLAKRVADIQAARAQGIPTVPTTIGLERATNPFVRPGAVRAALEMDASVPDAAVFAEVRRRKDNF